MLMAPGRLMVPAGAYAGDPSLTLDLNFQSAALDSRVAVTRSGTAWAFNASGVLTSSATNGARFDYPLAGGACLGLLLEEARTNTVRNSTAASGAVGAPGSLPTNWQLSLSAGISREIVAIGTTNGMNYVDFKFSGTASAGDTVLFFDSHTNASAAASNGQTWASSAYLALVGGSLTNVTPKQGLRYRTAAGASIGSQTFETAVTLTATLTRFARTATASDATVAFVNGSVCLTMAAGAVDITVRVAQPQVELGAYESSPIVTTGSAGTRAVEAATISSLSPWFNASAGTLMVETALLGSVVSRNVLSISDNTANETYQINTTSGGAPRWAVVDGGVASCSFSAPSVTATVDTAFRVVAAYALNDFAACANGNTVATDTSGTLPTVDRLYLAASGTGGSLSPQRLRRLRYYNVRKPDAVLQQLSTV